MKPFAAGLLAITLLFLLLTAGASAATKRVAIEGDSLTDGSKQYMHGALPGWTVSQTSAVGRHVSEGLDHLQSRRLTGYQVVVFALGTNDYQAAGSWYRQQLEAALAKTGSSRCMVVPTLYEGNGSNKAAAWNTVISSFARAHGPKRVQVVPWATAVAHGTVHLGDGTHPGTSSSWKKRATMVAAGVKSCYAALNSGGGSGGSGGSGGGTYNAPIDVSVPAPFWQPFLMDYETSTQLDTFDATFNLPDWGWQVDSQLGQYRVSRKFGKKFCSAALSIEADVFDQEPVVSGKYLKYSGGKLRIARQGSASNSAVDDTQPDYALPLVPVQWWAEAADSKGFVGIAEITLPDDGSLDGYQYALLFVTTVRDRQDACKTWSKAATDAAATMALSTFVYGPGQNADGSTSDPTVDDSSS